MDFDVIIVGARVAGAVLAALLGAKGFRVLLLEKARFPSDTLSTHFFRAPALRVFEKLGVLDRVKSAAPPLTTVWNYIDGHVISDPVDAGEDHLRYFLCGEAAWESSMSDYHTQARTWSEKSYRRTATYAADLRPMTRLALQKRGMV